MLDQEWERINAYKQRKDSEEAEREIERTMRRLSDGGPKQDVEALRKKAEKFFEDYGYSHSHYRSRVSRVISMHLRDRRIEVNSFSEALRHPELLNEVPQKFDLRRNAVRLIAMLTSRAIY